MNTPIKPTNTNINYTNQSENSVFSRDYNLLDQETRHMKTQIEELKAKNIELLEKVRQQEFLILDYQDQMNKIKMLKPPEGLTLESSEFLKTKLIAYEEIVPSSLNYPQQILANLVLFKMETNKEKIEEKLAKINDRLEKVGLSLKSKKKMMKISQKKVQNNNNCFPTYDLLQAFYTFRDKLSKGPKSDDLVYADEWKIKIDLPLQDLKSFLFFMIQAEEIVKNFHQSMIKNYISLKTNLTNFQRIVEILPNHYALPQKLSNLYLEIIEDLKAFNSQLQKESPNLLKLENFDKNINKTQETLVLVLQIHQDLLAKNELIQNKINTLYPELEEHIKQIYLETQKIKGAKIKTIN